MDFTQKKYREFCQAIVKEGYTSVTVAELVQNSDLKLNEKKIILRHDVDRMSSTALDLAIIENEFGLKASYYFRLPYSFDKEIISNISKLNHEIGLHYETVDKAKGDMIKAKAIMDKELAIMRELGEIQTVSMHGNPLSKFDNRDFWKHYKLESFNIIGEVYLSIDFEKVLYFSDTGRTWEDNKYNLKDIIPSNQKRITNKKELKTTNDLISFLKENECNLYINTHPERWSKNLFHYSIAFIKDLLFNGIKTVMIAKNKIKFLK